MANTSKQAKSGDVEVQPDAWERFTAAVDQVVRSSSKPSEAKANEKPKRRIIPA